jgi:glycosyltransferase involved in cell wall biosynthesis
MSLRILTLSYEYPPIGGGGSRVAQGLVQEFLRLGHRIDVVTMGCEGVPAMEEEDGLRVFRLGEHRKRIDSSTMHELVWHEARILPHVMRMVRENSYDVAHTHFIFPDGVLSALVARFQGLPFVVTAHGSDVPGYNPDRFHLAHRLLAPVWHSVVRSAGAIVCPSGHIEGLIRERSRRAPTRVIPNGIDLEKFSPSEPKEPGSILVVTRMVERKGVQDLIRALAEFELRTRVDIVGDGPYLNELKRLASELGVDVIFHGWVDNDSSELKELYERASIFCFTSSSENFPINLLEAMVAGQAIVTSSAGGCGEVVGEAGILVEPGNVTQVGQALQRLLSDEGECRRLGREARRRVEEEFSWSSVAARYKSVLLEHARAATGMRRSQV